MWLLDVITFLKRENQTRLIDKKPTAPVATPTESGVYSAQKAIQQLKDSQIRDVLDRASLAEVYRYTKLTRLDDLVTWWKPGLDL